MIAKRKYSGHGELLSKLLETNGQCKRWGWKIYYLKPGTEIYKL